MNNLDLTRPLQTRDGREVNILSTGERNNPAFPIVGEVKSAIGNGWHLQSWTVEGFCRAADPGHDPCDLVNIEESHKVYLNYYPEQGFGHHHYSLEEAEKMASVLPNCAVVICVEVVGGAVKAYKVSKRARCQRGQGGGGAYKV